MSNTFPNQNQENSLPYMLYSVIFYMVTGKIFFFNHSYIVSLG